MQTLTHHKKTYECSKCTVLAHQLHSIEGGEKGLAESVLRMHATHHQVMV